MVKNENFLECKINHGTDIISLWMHFSKFYLSLSLFNKFIFYRSYWIDASGRHYVLGIGPFMVMYGPR